MRYKPLLILIADVLIEEEETRALFLPLMRERLMTWGLSPLLGPLVPLCIACISCRLLEGPRRVPGEARRGFFFSLPFSAHLALCRG